MPSGPPPAVHTLPAPFSTATVLVNGQPEHNSHIQHNDQFSQLQLLTQGAEALVFKTTFLTNSTPCALKYRPPKSYRHPILDRRLTKARLLAEARVLVKCRKEGVRVPGVLGADWEAGWLALEYIHGPTIRQCLDDFLHTLPQSTTAPASALSATSNPSDDHATGTSAAEKANELWDLMARVGRAVGQMHEIGIVHGDLTTSNLLLRQSENEDPAIQSTNSDENQTSASRALRGEIYLIDFGLALQTVQEEDKAVDLYVLERAFSATHPAAENLFREVLRVYGESSSRAKGVLRKLEDVRLRGRKRSMIG